MSAFAIDPTSELGAGTACGECSPTSLYQNLQTLHLQQPGPVAGVQATSLQRGLPFSAGDGIFRPEEQYINGPYPLEVAGPSFTMDALPQMAVVGEDHQQAVASSTYGCGVVPLVHPNLQMIREDVSSSQGTVSDSGSDFSQTYPRSTVSPPHPVISVTDALGRVMPVVMVTQSDAPESTNAIPMDDSAAAASLADFPAGYFTGCSNSGNYVTFSNPLNLSNTSACHSSDTTDLCSTIIRTQRSVHELRCDLSRALETSSAKELVQRCDVESGLFFLANASVSLEVRVTHDAADEHASGDKSADKPGAAMLCFRHLAGDVVLYDVICRDLVSRLLL